MPIETFNLNNVAYNNERDFIPKIDEREHMARPYPGKEYDVLMINVPTSYQQGVIPDGEEPPHGMLRVISSAMEKGWNMGILDAHRLKLSPEQIFEQLQRIKPKIVGLNPTSINVGEGITIYNMCERLDIPVLLGGVHATLNVNSAREDFPKATIIKGNGEVAINEVLESLLKNGEKSGVNGIYYVGQEVGTRNDYAKKLNPELIPMVDQRLLVEDPVFKQEIIIAGTKRIITEATLFSTDGCPFDCNFCSSAGMVGRHVNGMKPYSRPRMERIINEITHCIKDLGADAIHFLDDMAFVKPEHIEELYNGMETAGIVDRFIWRGLTRVNIIDKFDDRIMKIMSETGAWKIALGIESGDDRMLHQINKKITSKQAVNAVNKLVGNGIQAKGFFMMGFPGETEEQLNNTYKQIMRLKSLGMTDVSVFQFKPYPGTTIYGELVEKDPNIESKLSYLRRSNIDFDGKAQERVESAVWLPDDLKIAEVSSGKVKELVIKALDDFYRK